MSDDKKSSTTHKYSLQERIELIKIYYGGKSLKQTARIFAEKHPNSEQLPNSSTIAKLVKRFETTGSVHDKPKSGRPKRKKPIVKQEEETCACIWPGCDFTTNAKKNLVRHQLVHKTERDFVCDWPQCDKRFKSKLNLRNHLRIHNNDRRYVCDWPQCDYRCVDSGNIRKHKKIHENKFREFVTKMNDN